jgi:hypothetical protein
MHKSLNFLISLWLAGFAAIAGPACGQEKNMTVDFYHSAPQDVRRPAAPSTAIRDGRPLSLPPGREPATGSHNQFGNSERNSRLGFPLGKTADHPRWSSDLPSHTTAQTILAGDGHVVIHAREGWLLFDSSGQMIRQGIGSDGDVILDPPQRLFYAPTNTGYVGAYSLEDGKQQYFLTPFFGNEFRRDFIRRRGTQMLILSVERPRPSHSKVPANLSVIEIQDLSRTMEISESGRLKSAEQADYLKRKTVLLLAAMHQDTLALATEDSLSLANANLQLKREFTGGFQPLWLSMDELSRCYLIVKSGTGLALWVVTPDGERVVNVSLPQDLQPIAPPVVALDHTVYVIGANTLIAVDPLGTQRWQKQEVSGIAGAAVTSDGWLLVATGSELVAYEAGGKRERVLLLENDAFCTAPAVGDHGELFIAGQRRLYRIY